VLDHLPVSIGFKSFRLGDSAFTIRIDSPPEKLNTMLNKDLAVRSRKLYQPRNLFNPGNILTSVFNFSKLPDPISPPLVVISSKVDNQPINKDHPNKFASKNNFNRPEAGISQSCLFQQHKTD
jgi:hypothetical protein